MEVLNSVVTYLIKTKKACIHLQVTDIQETITKLEVKPENT